MIVALGLGLYADFGRLGDELASFRWELFPLALALTALNYLLRFWRWQRYLARLEIEVPTGRSFAIFVAGLSGTITPAKLGEVLKCALLETRLLLGMTALSAVSWFFECLAAYVCVRGLRLDLSLVDTVVVFSLGSLAGALSFLPGGLGVAEGSMTGLIRVLGDVSKAGAVAATVLIRLATLWFAVALGLAGLAVDEVLYRRQPVRRSSMR